MAARETSYGRFDTEAATGTALPPSGSDGRPAGTVRGRHRFCNK
jgi:hypothetical protein